LIVVNRQNEWEDYRSYHPNVIQGDLADPLYFDFISFCQYAVIANKMRNGKIDFIEKVLSLILYVAYSVNAMNFHQLEKWVI